MANQAQRRAAGPFDAVPEESVVREFQASLGGELLRPGDEGYDDARAIRNGMIDKRPAMIVRCSGTADIIAAVRFARERDLLVAVRGGGHNIAGTRCATGGSSSTSRG